MSESLQNQTQQEAPPPKLLLTIEEAAQVLSLGRTLFYELLSRKEIYTIKIGRARRVPVIALEDFVSRQVAQQKEKVAYVEASW